MTIKDYLSVAPEIQQAIDEGRPVVAIPRKPRIRP